jgi:GTPase SAR1 family protein
MCSVAKLKCVEYKKIIVMKNNLMYTPNIYILNASPKAGTTSLYARYKTGIFHPGGPTEALINEATTEINYPSGRRILRAHLFQQTPAIIATRNLSLPDGTKMDAGIFVVDISNSATFKQIDSLLALDFFGDRHAAPVYLIINKCDLLTDPRVSEADRKAMQFNINVLTSIAEKHRRIKAVSRVSAITSLITEDDGLAHWQDCMEVFSSIADHAVNPPRTNEQPAAAAPSFLDRMMPVGPQTFFAGKYKHYTFDLGSVNGLPPGQLVAPSAPPRPPAAAQAFPCSPPPKPSAPPAPSASPPRTTTESDIFSSPVMVSPQPRARAAQDIPFSPLAMVPRHSITVEAQRAMEGQPRCDFNYYLLPVSTQAGTSRLLARYIEVGAMPNAPIEERSYKPSGIKTLQQGDKESQVQFIQNLTVLNAWQLVVAPRGEKIDAILLVVDISNRASFTQIDQLLTR